MRRSAFSSWVFSVLLFGCAAAKDKTLVKTMTTIYVVRHAEKLNSEQDTPLSPAGEQRALALADRLSDAGVQRIYATTRRRTRQTVAPLAERIGIDVVLTEPGAVDSLVRLIRVEEQGNVLLIAGHNNTVPRIVEGLSGRPAEPIPEHVFDQLYRIQLSLEGKATVEVLRYGTPTP